MTGEHEIVACPDCGAPAQCVTTYQHGGHRFGEFDCVHRGNHSGHSITVEIEAG